MPLWNTLSKPECLKILAKETFPRKTVSFYRYVKISDPEQLRGFLYRDWSRMGVLGRVYVASEGMNAQISVPEPSWESFEKNLNAVAEFSQMPFKFAVQDGLSFWKLIVRTRPKIVADGLPDDAFDVSNVGKHLNAEEFHRAMEDDNTLVVDMRNHYESRIGKFEHALTPNAETFKEELPMVKELLKGKEKKKILLYCTGGIRCEKASAYLKHEGFQDVNQLFGGIIQYAHEVRKKGLRSRFLGRNFVFDDRLSERVTEDILTTCEQCQKLCDEYRNCRYHPCNLLFLQCPSCHEKYEGCCSSPCLSSLRLTETRA